MSELFKPFVLDFVARQSVGGIHLAFGIIKQLAIPSKSVLGSKNALWRNGHENWT